MNLHDHLDACIVQRRVNELNARCIINVYVDTPLVDARDATKRGHYMRTIYTMCRVHSHLSGDTRQAFPTQTISRDVPRRGGIALSSLVWSAYESQCHRK